jgi:hypothetical protein
MLTKPTFTGKRLPLTIAFVLLLMASFGAGCKGFFTGNALESIAIQPPSPEVQVGESTTLQAWGTYEDNTRSQITSGVVWTSDTPDAVTIDPNTGLITGQGTGGQATITAAAQGLSATATATAFLGNVTNFQICTGTFNTGHCPAATWGVSGTQGGSQNYYAVGNVTINGTQQAVDLTTVATWDVTPTATTGSVTCDNTSTPAICTVEPQTTPTGQYTITVQYPGGTVLTATAIIQVN